MFEIPLVTLIEWIILFDNRYYNQADWVAMVPLWSKISNFFCVTTKLCALKNAQSNSDQNITKYLWMTILYFFQKPANVQQSAAYMNQQHPNIRFEINRKNAKEWWWKEWHSPFRENDNITTKIHRKTSFSGFVRKCKFGLLFTNVIAFFCLASDVSKFHMALEKLQKLFRNAYPQKFIDKCIFKFWFQRRNSEWFFLILEICWMLSNLN